MNKPILNSKTVTEITRGALPGSRKIFVDGVPFREVALSGGEAPVRLYDTSGPYTDETAGIDIEKGLAARRREWILARGDVEEYEGRARRPEDDGLKRGELLSVPQFDRAGRKPLRARPGRNVSQLHYARQGLITEEMKFIAARENLGRSALARWQLVRRIDSRPDHGGIRARRDRARPRHHTGQHQSPGNRADDHRPQFPHQGEREYRQLDRHIGRGGGGRETRLVDPLGRRHCDGPFDRASHPHDPRVDHQEFTRPDRNSSDLPGAGESRRRRRGPDLGDLSRHARRTMRAGRRLFHRACGPAPGAHPADCEPRHRHRIARRLDPRQMVSRASQGELPLHAFRGHLRAPDAV